MTKATLSHVGLLVESEVDRADRRWAKVHRDTQSRFAMRNALTSSMYHMAIAEALSAHMVNTTGMVFEIADREAMRCGLPIDNAREIVIEKLRPHFSALAREAGNKAGSMGEMTRKGVAEHMHFAFKEFDRRAELYRAGMFKPEGPNAVTNYNISQSGSGNSLNANLASPGASINSTSSSVLEAVYEVEHQLPESGISSDDIETMRELLRLIAEQAQKQKPSRAVIGPLLDGAHRVVSMTATLVKPEFTTALSNLADKVAALV